MTNEEKRELRQLCKKGDSFEEIRGVVDCCDATIRNYIKIFSPYSRSKYKLRRFPYMMLRWETEK